MKKTEIYMSLAKTYATSNDKQSLLDLVKKEGVKESLLYLLYATNKEDWFQEVLKLSSLEEAEIRHELYGCDYNLQQVDEMMFAIGKPEFASAQAIIKEQNWEALAIAAPKKLASLAQQDESLWVYFDNKASAKLLAEYNRKQELEKRQEWNHLAKLEGTYETLLKHEAYKAILQNCKTEDKINAIEHLKRNGRTKTIVQYVSSSFLIENDYLYILQLERRWEDLYLNNRPKSINWDDFYENGIKPEVIKRALDKDVFSFLCKHKKEWFKEEIENLKEFYLDGGVVFALAMIGLNAIIGIYCQNISSFGIAGLVVLNIIYVFFTTILANGNLREWLKYITPLNITWLASLYLLFF